MIDKCIPGKKIAHTITVIDGRIHGVDVKNLDLENFNVPIGDQNPSKSDAATSRTNRDIKVKEWILQNSNGICELCDNPAPFITIDETPYLEVHHIQHMANGGSDTVSNAVALCLNCHREIHYGKKNWR